MHKLLLTFDYELFLGKDSGSAEECMILPTEKILEVLQTNQVKGAVFFVDTTYLLKLKEYANTFTKVKEDLEAIANQIKKIVSLGHYVFPHIHPHWEDAIYLENTNKWDLSNNVKYKFSSISNELKDSMFSKSIEILSSIIHPIVPDFKFDAYRAGGYSIQPFSDFKKYFDKHNIKYEFSVLKDFYELGNNYGRFFDFRNITHLNYYKFNNIITQVDYTGNFVEFTISSIRLTKIQIFLNRINLKIGDTFLRRYYFGKGVGAEFSEVVKTSSSFQIASFEFSTIVKFNKMWKKFKSESYLQTITHPKMMSEYDLKMLDKFIKKATNEYKEVCFDFREIKADKPNVLICSHILPPQPGIGGRRWAKFAKYLTRNNYNLKLLTSEPTELAKDISPWTNDVNGLSIQFIKRKYSDIMERKISTIFEKIAYRITINFYLIKHEGSVYDKGINWEAQFAKALDELIIKENIYCTIATGAPFSLMYYNAKLKDKYKSLKVINDFRDPWTWGEIYGFRKIEPSRLKFEDSREQFVLKNSDFVTSSAEFIHEALLKKYANYTSKICLIPHAYDTDEIQRKQLKTKLSKRTKIVFGGTLYENLDKDLRSILDFIKRNKDKVEIDFYVSINPYETIFSEYSYENIRVFTQLNSTDFITKLMDYDFYLTFANERIKENVSTKYYEVIASKLPFLYVGPNGRLKSIISKYNIGLVYTDIQSESNALETMLDCNQSQWGFDTFPIEEYSFEFVTKQLELIINKPLYSTN